MTDYPELDDPLSLAKWIIEFEFFDPKNRHMNAQQLAEIYANKIQALMVRERVDELKKFKAIFATSLDVETYDALAKRIEHLSASSSPCGRNYDDGGAHTIQTIDGVACCPACKQPIAAHKKGSGNAGKQS